MPGRRPRTTSLRARAGAWRWPRPLSRVAGPALALLLALGLIADVVTGEDKPAVQYSEEQVKAAILVGFAKTTEWPPGTFKEGPKTFVIGILGRDTLGEKATAPFTDPAPASGQTVRFKVVVDDAAARDCHVLYIPRPERRRTHEIVDRLRHAPVLTVGETEDFLDQEGMVNLVPTDGKLKFEINLNAAKAANLKIPAKVLGTALKVRGKYD